MKKISMLVLLFLCLLSARTALGINAPSIAGLQELLDEGENEQVVAIADSMLEALRPTPPPGARWLCFADDAYRYLYQAMHPEAVFDTIDYDVVNVLYMKAYAHYELAQHTEAIRALTEALAWDPVALQVRFELLHNYRQMGMQAREAEEMQTLWGLLLYPEDFARFYRSLGSALVDAEDYEKARPFLLFSLYFEDSFIARSELSYIDEQLGEVVAADLEDDALKAALLEEAATRAASAGWGFSLSADQWSALSRLAAQEQESGSSSGPATESLSLYQELLPALPPQDKSLPGQDGA